jgi:exopolyphosphatase/guanosine-5'-triphosphate,3'-diphosphate pyrophosphatase
MRSAIIDIGYNAIRVVIHDSDKLGSLEIFNNKFRSDIRTLLSLSDLEINHHTYLSFEYITHIIKNLSVKKIKCVATAVLRNHPKSQEFITIIKRKFNIDIEILSGEKEAQLMATGLISGVVNASGIVADLGGGSLELAEIFNKKISVLESLPIGTKIKVENYFCDELIEKIFINKATKYQNLYLVGGAFRIIGKHYIQYIKYPLKNLHNLTISTIDFLNYLNKLLNIKFQKIGDNSLFFDKKAVYILQSMIRVIKPENIVISNYGLKEGVRFYSLDEHEQQKNLIFERIKTITKFNEDICEIQKYILLVKNLLISNNDLTLDTIKLSIMLTHFNKNIDKNLKASFILDFILSCDIPFINSQRIMLALTLTQTYSSKNDLYINKLAQKILTNDDYKNSLILGNFLKLAQHIDGPEFISPSFELQVNNSNNIIVTTYTILPKSIFKLVIEHIKIINSIRNDDINCF